MPQSIPNQATHWSEAPDGQIIYYNIGTPNMIWLGHSKVWEKTETIPYTIFCCDDIRPPIVDSDHELERKIYVGLNMTMGEVKRVIKTVREYDAEK